MLRLVRALATVVSLALAFGPPVCGADLRVFVRASGTATHADGPSGWLDEGWGKLLRGGGAGRSAASSAEVDLQTGFRVDVGRHWTVWTHTVARIEGDVEASGKLGIAELWIEGTRELGGGSLHARAGTFFLPTSRENVAPLWSSPYTSSLSAINSWIAEEVRPTGLDLEYRYELAPAIRLRGAVTAVAGNDTAGALLGWRGWSASGRLSTWNEDLPLPPLDSLAVSFPAQKDSTTAFGEDLDHRIGWSTRLRVDSHHGLTALWTRFDNRGDRALHDGQYAWRTSFDLWGVTWRPLDPLTLAAEHITGRTAMGFAPADRVDASFESTYLLASAQVREFVLSCRYDWFETRERDFSGAENNDERGSALALALAVEFSPAWAITVEFDDLDASRPAAFGALGSDDLDGRILFVRASYSVLLD